jgi:hypothetical protein
LIEEAANILPSFSSSIRNFILEISRSWPERDGANNASEQQGSEAMERNAKQRWRRQQASQTPNSTCDFHEDLRESPDACLPLSLLCVSASAT